MNNLKIEEVINYITIILFTTSYIVMLITFATAYLNHNEVLVTLNQYGEANLEAAILLATLPIITFCAYKNIHNFISQKTNK